MKNNRWFIWTLVFLIVAGVGLVAYINIASDSEASQAIPNMVVHQVKPVPTPVAKK